MGFFKNIAKKISNAVASLKSSASQKVLRKADINITNQTVKDGQILAGRANFDEKRYEYEDNATNHFATYFKGKSLEDVAQYVTDMRNFSSESEFVRQINERNRRRAMAGDKSRLSVDDLYNYFAGGQGLSDKDKEAYRQIASQTQARARALSYIKANFVGICNMNELGSEKDKKAFKKIMDTVKLFADKDINNYAVADFDPERINSAILDSADIYLKGASYAETRTREIFERRADEILNIANEGEDIITDFKNDTDAFDNKIDQILEANKTVDNKTNENKSLDTLDSQLRDAYDKISKNTEGQRLGNLWISGSKHSKGEKKAIIERQKQFISAFTDIAHNFQLFGADENGNILVSNPNGEITIDDKKYTNVNNNIGNYDLFSVHADKSDKSDYSKLSSLIGQYNSDEENKNNQFFVVKSDKNNGKKIYTVDQDRIMSDIYQRLVEHAVETVQDENYQGTNALKNFGCKNFRHSINNDTLSNLSKVIFGADFDKNTKTLAYEELSGEQTDALYDFIINNDPVKSLLSNSDVKILEIDNILTSSINPNSNENTETPEKCMLNAVMNDIRIKNLQNEINREKATKNDNDKEIESANINRKNDFEEAKKIQERIKSAPGKLSQISKINFAEHQGKINIESMNIFAYQTTNQIANFVSLPAKVEELTETQNTPIKYSDFSTNINNENYIIEDLLYAIKKFYNVQEATTNSDKAKFDSLTIKQKAELYKQYFTKEDKQTVEEFVEQIDDMIKSQNVLTTADIGLEERVF